MFTIADFSQSVNHCTFSLLMDNQRVMLTPRLSFEGYITNDSTNLFYEQFNLLIERNSILNSSNLTDFGKEIINRLICIPGIINIEMRNYRVTISKNPIFSWDEIIQFIENFLNQNYDNFNTFLNNCRSNSFLSEEFSPNYKIISLSDTPYEATIQFRKLLSQKGRIITIFEQSVFNHNQNTVDLIDDDTLKLITRRGKKIIKHIKNDFNFEDIVKITFLSYSLCITFQSNYFMNEHDSISETIRNWEI